MKKLFFLIALSILSVTLHAKPSASDAAVEQMCAKVSKNINLLANFTQTSCTPFKEGSKFGLLLLSKDRIFDNPKAKRAYLTVLVAAAGMELNNSSGLPVEKVNFIDKELAGRQSYFTIPGRDAARLQSDVRGNRIDLNGFYDAILSSSQVLVLKK